MDDRTVETIVAEHHGSLGGMLSILTAIQSEYGYLPEDALRRMAAATGESLTDIYAVVTFYKAFSLKPRGKHLVSVCLGTACHVRGAPKIAEEFIGQLGIASGETTPDKEFTLETVNCLGACALGPIVVVDGRYYSNVRKNQVAEILKRTREGLDQPRENRRFPLSVRCPHCRQSLMDAAHPIDNVPSIRLTMSWDGDSQPLYLSSLHGSLRSVCERETPAHSITVLACPMCGQDLVGDSRCSECGADMARMTIDKGATLMVCTRRGCAGRRLNLETTPAEAD